jgi:hypothetical protein
MEKENPELYLLYTEALKHLPEIERRFIRDAFFKGYKLMTRQEVSNELEKLL